MPEKQILVYQASKILEPSMPLQANFDCWSPSIDDFVPPGKPKKYVLYSLFHLLSIFKNKKYSSYYSSEKSTIICSFLAVPAYYRWPFMQKNSVQFTYIITEKEHRGKGLAWQGIFQAFTELKKEGIVSFWYITDSQNQSSQRLAEKMGFQLIGVAEKKEMMFGTIKFLQLHETK